MVKWRDNVAAAQPLRPLNDRSLLNVPMVPLELTPLSLLKNVAVE